MVNYVTDKESMSLDLLVKFVKAVDDDFSRPLVGRIDIDAWTEKIYRKGSVVLAEMDGKYIGVLFYYSNDMVDRRGYISYLAVDFKCRGMGVARSMLKRCIELSEEAGMCSIDVYTNNPIACALYQSAGFDVMSQDTDNEFNLVQTYLTKQL